MNRIPYRFRRKGDKNRRALLAQSEIVKEVFDEEREVEELQDVMAMAWREEA